MDYWVGSLAAVDQCNVAIDVGWYTQYVVNSIQIH